MSRIMELLFGCWHKHLAFPQTSKLSGRTYVVCLDCGKEFSYDWTRMKIRRAA